MGDISMKRRGDESSTCNYGTDKTHEHEKQALTLALNYCVAVTQYVKSELMNATLQMHGETV
jgi:hypothetical protein